MILALILSDLNDLPPPPDDHNTSSRILTPLSLRHFPFSHCEESRKLALSPSLQTRLSGNRVPSLVELCLDSIRTSKNGYDLQQPCSPSSVMGLKSSASLEEQLENLSLLEPFQLNTPFFLQSSSILEDKKHSARLAVQHIPRVVFLSPATVIVVPLNLVSQWEGQILLHCNRDLHLACSP